MVGGVDDFLFESHENIPVKRIVSLKKSPVALMKLVSEKMTQKHGNLFVLLRKMRFIKNHFMLHGSTRKISNIFIDMLHNIFLNLSCRRQQSSPTSVYISWSQWQWAAWLLWALWSAQGRGLAFMIKLVIMHFKSAHKWILQAFNIVVTQEECRELFISLGANEKGYIVYNDFRKAVEEASAAW